MPPTYEKLTERVIVHCRPSERQKWMQTIEPRELSRTIRQLMNKLCERKRKP